MLHYIFIKEHQVGCEIVYIDYSMRIFDFQYYYFCIIIHSTATPGVMAAEWFSRWNKSYTEGETNRQVCVHAFVDDKEVWQYLPWNHRGWHAGGKANDTHIGIEICEPGGFYYSSGEMKGYDARVNEAYFKAAWDNAINLCVFLCRVYGF